MLTFNTLLNIADINPNSCKLARHTTNGANGRTPYSVWRNGVQDFERYQSIQSNLVFGRDWLASFVKTSSNKTLFVGLFRVEGVSRNEEAVECPVSGNVFEPNGVNIYQLTRDPRLESYEKRLLIDWGPGALAWVQNADTQPKRIIELRRADYEVEFPGYFKFHEKISDLRQPYANWTTALTAVRGIYLLTFDDGEQYVGSATGAQGFWQRWQDYLQTGHGGNQVLMNANRDARDANVSILEVSGSTATRPDIIGSEMIWQQKLGSRAKRLDDE